MQTYRIETVIADDRELTIRNLPFRSGEKVEVIILSKTGKSTAKKSYSLRDKPVRYVEPFTPVAEDGWHPSPWSAQETWRQHPGNDPEEAFADMFLGWVFDMWADDQYGRERADFMNGLTDYVDTGMPLWVQLSENR